MFGRRAFTQRALGAAAAALLPRAARAADDFDPMRDIVGVLFPGLAQPLVSLTELGNQSAMGLRFHRWMAGQGFARDRTVRNLVFNFYDTDKSKGSWVYPMLCGKAIIWLLGRKRMADAIAVAEALLRWQQTTSTTPGSKSYGSFPSAIDRDPKAASGKRASGYYSGDNLVILDAFIQLYGGATRARSGSTPPSASAPGCATSCAQGLKYRHLERGPRRAHVVRHRDRRFFQLHLQQRRDVVDQRLYRLGTDHQRIRLLPAGGEGFRFYKLSQTTEAAPFTTITTLPTRPSHIPPSAGSPTGPAGHLRQRPAGGAGPVAAGASWRWPARPSTG